MKHKNTSHDPRDTETNGKQRESAKHSAEETDNRESGGGTPRRAKETTDRASREKHPAEATSNGANRAKRRTRRLLAVLAVVLLLDLLVPVAAFTVLFLRPAGGFSNPPVAVEIPDVTGLDETEAKSRLAALQVNREGACFTVTAEYRYDADTPRGTVLSQTPTAGSRRKVTPGIRPCPVTVVVSLGKETAAVPDLCGKTFREAETLLRSLGFVAEVRVQVAGNRAVTVAEGATASLAGTTVIAVSPPAGTETELGETVTLTVRKPSVRPAGSGTVPDLTGLTRDEAQYRLLSAGFSVGEIRELRPEGGYPAGEAVVTAQQYLAGTRMKRGTSVGFTLAARPLPVLPEIESETETEPETVGETQTEPSAPRRPGLFRWVPGTR